MFRMIVLAVVMLATPVEAGQNPCLDYIKQREAAATLALVTIIVQTRLLIMSELPNLSPAARKIIREASDDLASGIAENTNAMTKIMKTTTCR